MEALSQCELMEALETNGMLWKVAPLKQAMGTKHGPAWLVRK